MEMHYLGAISSTFTYPFGLLLQNNYNFQFALYFVDHLSKFSLPREGLERHKKRRQKRTDEVSKMRHVERQEEMARKKEDARRDEYQKMLDEQDPEKQKRMEFELNKKDNKRNQRKNMKMKQMKIRT